MMGVPRYLYKLLLYVLYYIWQMVLKPQRSYNGSLDAQRYWEQHSNSWRGCADSAVSPDAEKAAILKNVPRRMTLHGCLPHYRVEFPMMPFRRSFIFSCPGGGPSPSHIGLPKNPSAVWLPPFSFSLFCLRFLLRRLQNRDERFRVLTLSLVIYFSLLWGRRLWKMWEQFTHQCFRAYV